VGVKKDMQKYEEKEGHVDELDIDELTASAAKVRGQ
jgi:hypothetical protein